MLTMLKQLWNQVNELWEIADPWQRLILLAEFIIIPASLFFCCIALAQNDFVWLGRSFTTCILGVILFDLTLQHIKTKL